MKPDKHKKKRSAQYNKKKGGQSTENSENRGKGNVKSSTKDEARGEPKTSKQGQGVDCGPSASRKGVDCGPSASRRGADSAANSKELLSSSDSSSSSDDDISTPTQHGASEDGREPTFRRRKIVSNWERYEEPEEDIHLENEHGETILDILSQEDEEIQRLSEISAKNEKPEYKTEFVLEHLSGNIIDLGTTSSDSEQWNGRNICASNHRELDLNSKLAECDIGKHDKELDFLLSLDAPQKQTVVESTTPQNLAVSDLTLCQEKELDVLLSLDAKQRGYVHSTEQQAVSSVEQVDIKVKLEENNSAQLKEVCQKSPGNAGKESENLEDWLDSVLGD